MPLSERDREELHKQIIELRKQGKYTAANELYAEVVAASKGKIPLLKREKPIIQKRRLR